VTDVIQISSNEVVENIRIYNILGTVVREFDANGITQFDVNDLLPGTYLVALSDENQDILKTLKINKQ
jgi:hypothetical protein